MVDPSSSSDFTEWTEDSAFGPPLIGALLRRPWEAVQRRMLDRLHEHGFNDIEPWHMAVFRYPGPHGARPSQLAAQLRMSKQALNYLLGDLEQLGYLERRPDPDDKRSKRIALTQRGLATVTVVRAAVAEMETTWSHQLGPERFRELRAALVELNQPPEQAESETHRR
jgi:DNA-binding MarR family transcriptional regulator